jgi:nucleoside-diphosphate-sugar epimerase
VRILLTGAAGFVGSHLVDRLLVDGHEVIGVDNLATGREGNLAHLGNNPRFRLVRADASRPLDIDGPVDWILHLASPASPPRYLERPIETLLVNAEGARHLLELALRSGAGFLMASTSEVYGDPHVHPQPESYWGNVNPIGPRSVYDEGKRYAEAITMAYQRQHGLRTRICRIFNTYGPRMEPHDGRVVSNFVRQALAGEPLTVYGDGSQTRSFQYVDDLVEGIVRLLASDTVDPVNLGNPNEFTMIELAHLVLELTGSQSELVFEQLPEDDPRQRRPDISRARDLLGWQPRVALRDGLQRTIQAFSEQADAQER